MAIKWTISKKDSALLEQCMDRLFADKSPLSVGWQTVRRDATMDINAAHSNGCPLDFQKLLDFPDFDFFHDVDGTRTHIDRKTGKLQHHFVPRCAQPEHANI